MDSIQSVTESTKNAVLEALVKRDEENKSLKHNNAQVQARLNQVLNEVQQLENKLKNKNAKIDSLQSDIELLSSRLRRSSIEQQYPKKE